MPRSRGRADDDAARAPPAPTPFDPLTADVRDAVGGGGAPPWPKANAPARAPPPPLVIDGALLRELLDLPADAQREVLTDAIDVEASDGEEEEDAGEGSRRSAPALPVEAVLGVIQRVLEP